MPATARVDASTRRRLIIDAAGPLFLERQFHEVTTKELAEAAGVSEALIFQHFGSKQGLYVAVVEAGVDDITDTFHRAMKATTQLPEASIEELEGIFARALDFWFADPSFLRSFLTEPNAEDVRRTYYQVLLDQEAKALPKLTEARRLGLVPDVDPRVLLRAFLGQALIFVVTEEWLGGKDMDPIDRSSLARELAQLWAGIFTAPR